MTQDQSQEGATSASGSSNPGWAAVKAGAAGPLTWLLAGALVGFAGSDWLGFARELPRLSERIAALEQRLTPAGLPSAIAQGQGEAEADVAARPVSTEGAPHRGAAQPLVSIVAFSDFQCPFCTRAHPTIQRLLKEYPDVALYFRHKPLPFHPDARLAHRATLAAGAQDHFWEMHDRIFENPRDLGRATLISHAKELGLDVTRFTRDLDDEALDAPIERDLAESDALGVTGTPTFFINGHQVAGAQPYANFKQLVDRELAARKASPPEQHSRH